MDDLTAESAHDRWPMPLDTTDQDLIFVGRLRRDISNPDALRGITFWCCGDQDPQGYGDQRRKSPGCSASSDSTGAAGSGESEICRYLLRHDLVDAIVAMPNDFFFNTGIATYIWVLDNAKEERRRGKVQLINANGIYSKMHKSLGSKRNEFSDKQIGRVVSLHRALERTRLRPSADILADQRAGGGYRGQAAGSFGLAAS